MPEQFQVPERLIIAQSGAARAVAIDALMQSRKSGNSKLEELRKAIQNFTEALQPVDPEFLNHEDLMTLLLHALNLTESVLRDAERTMAAGISRDLSQPETKS